MQKWVISIILGSLIGATGFVWNTHVRAQTIDEIQAKIDKRNDDIEALEKEIKSYQKQIDTLNAQASSLSSTIKSLELTRKQLEKKITLTEDKIIAKNLQIQRLGTDITRKEGDIDYDRKIIAKALLAINEAQNTSLVETLLSANTISSAWNSLEELGKLQSGVNERIEKLNEDKNVLVTNKVAGEKARGELQALKKQLGDEKAVILATTKEQSSLLKQTNQSEAEYKKILAKKKAEEEAFRREILEYESALNILINPALLPKAGKGVLNPPLSNIFVTQYFGNTDFSTANPQIYNGKGHTGIDYRASIGTPVLSALSGTVVGSSNTDAYPGCYSYGQWIMVKHDNGLSTLYAHLSLRSVEIGQRVGTGQIIGYSGNTGYSTGPHLHFGVYATQGVQIKKFDTSIRCKGATIPIADYSAYLNPLSYL